MDSWMILDLQNITYVMTQNTAAHIELEAMMVANKVRADKGEAPAYSYEAMMELLDKYQLYHNSVVTNLHNGR